MKNILFVCEHGAAKSIVASAWFNKLASQNGLSIRSIARGTHPDAELGPKAVEGLREDGLTPLESVPQKILLADVESAIHIVSFCEIPEEFKNKVTTESWADVPAVSDGYEAARDAIVKHINHLVSSL
ncbi:MAG TPA: hypothetical protein DCX53_01340 [Anaerolineae bacterium]|nr:hypothetical protein [Anaerolineae bacterium]